MTEYQLGDVARRKEALLRVPVVAHSKAAGFYRQALDRNDKDAAEVWAQVVRELESEGYAPDAAGNPGPAVKAHYQDGVFVAAAPASTSTTDISS